MKYLIRPFILLVLLLGVNKIFAQTAQTSSKPGQNALATANTKQVNQPPQMSPAQREADVATRMSKSYASNLSLTPAQSEKVYQACLSFVKEINSHKSGTPLTKEAHDKYVAEKDAKIKNALTTDQYSKYVTMTQTHGSVSQR